MKMQYSYEIDSETDPSIAWQDLECKAAYFVKIATYLQIYYKRFQQ